MIAFSPRLVRLASPGERCKKITSRCCGTMGDPRGFISSGRLLWSMRRPVAYATARRSRRVRRASSPSPGAGRLRCESARRQSSRRSARTGDATAPGRPTTAFRGSRRTSTRRPGLQRPHGRARRRVDRGTIARTRRLLGWCPRCTGRRPRSGASRTRRRAVRSSASRRCAPNQLSVTERSGIAGSDVSSMSRWTRQSS